MIERRKITDRQTWLRWRRDDFTASVTAALFGRHPYTTAFEQYQIHRGLELPDKADSGPLRRGRWMEDACANAAREERPEWTIRKANEYLRDPDLRLGCTPDFYVDCPVRGFGILQTKTAAPAQFESQWRNGEIVPTWIVLQASVEALLTDANFAAIACLNCNPYDPRVVVHEFKRNAGAEARIILAVRQFWDDVEHEREPSPEFAKDADLIKALNPREVAGKTVDLSGDNELPAMLAQRERIMEEMSERKDRKEEIEAHIRHKMKDAEQATGLADWSIIWNSYHRKESVQPAKDIRALHIKRMESK